MIGEHSVVAFTRLKNSRGLPLTGVVIDCDDEVALVRAYGLDGPGSTVEINEVPLSDLVEIDVPNFPLEPDDAP